MIRTCTNCGQQVSDDGTLPGVAIICPKCYSHIQTGIEPRIKNLMYSRRNKAGWGPLVFAVTILIILCCCIGPGAYVAWTIQQGVNAIEANERKSKPPQQMEAARKQARLYVAACLKFPLDAEFLKDSAEEYAPGRWRSSGLVKAKNGFGGVHTYVWSCDLDWATTKEEPEPHWTFRKAIVNGEEF